MGNTRRNNKLQRSPRHVKSPADGTSAAATIPKLTLAADAS